MDIGAVKAILGAFERAGVRYVVFGGVAMNLHGLARFTRDIDVFLAPDAENIDRLRAALNDLYDDPHIDEIRAEDLLGDYPAVQYIPPEGTFYLDILTRLGEAFSFDDLDVERVPFEDIMVSVATPSTLFRMKKDTVRPRDWDDARALAHHFDLEEE